MRITYLIPLFFALLSCTPKPTTVEKIDTFLSAEASINKFNGNVLVADKGVVIYQKSFGYADFEKKTALNDSSLFELASITKQFTALAILQLVEKGKLRLTDSLRQYFPELPYSNITIRQLLTHTSGLPDYMEVMDPKWDHHKIAFNEDMIAFLSKEKPALLFNPGTKWEYSNTAYAILATIIEKVSGLSYGDYLSANIFKPLGMTRTRIWNTRRSKPETISNYAYGVVYSDSLHKFILPDNDPRYPEVYYIDGIQGDGTVNSTTGDLLRWDRSLLKHSLASENTVKEMLGHQALMDTATSTYYGYGVLVGKNELGNFYGHSGGWPGYVTYYTRFTDDDKTIIVLSNNEASAPAISNGIANILYGNEIVLPYTHTSIALDSSIVRNFAGSFEVKGKTFRIISSNHRLVQISPTGKRRSFEPESANKLFLEGRGDLQFEFVPQSGGKPPLYFLISHGVKTQVRRTS